MSNDTIIDFIRHGEPVGGRAYRGSSIDDPLSDIGWQQMRSAIEDHHPWNSIVSSPLCRCLEFANELGERHAIPISIQRDFCEVGMGSWEGRDSSEIEKTDPEEYANYYKNPVTHRPAGAEPLLEFGARVATAIHKTLAATQNQHMLVVAHAGVIRAALGYFLEMKPEVWYRVRIDNAGLTRFLVGTNGVKLEFHNRNRLD